MGATVKLYELADAARILDEFLVEAEGELTPEIEALLDSLELDIKAKVEDVALYIQQLVATAAAVRLEEDRLSRRRKAAERTADGLRGYLLRNMMRLDLKKVEGSLVTVALQQNQPSVQGEFSQDQMRELYNLEAPFIEVIPESFRLDKRAVLETYKTTGQIPEGIEIARGVSLRIR